MSDDAKSKHMGVASVRHQKGSGKFSTQSHMKISLHQYV